MNGITRGNVIDLCVQNNIVCKVKNFSLFDVYGADEAFVTGTFGGLTHVVKIDGKTIGDGKCGSVTKRLSNLYQELVEKEIQSL